MTYFDPLAGESKSWDDLDREWEALTVEEQDEKLAKNMKECIDFKRREEKLPIIYRHELQD